MRTIGRKTLFCYGRRAKLNPKYQHERREDWPPRYLIDFRPERGKQYFPKCEVCTRRSRMWLTDDRFWKLLPGYLRKKLLCVRCFRAFVEER